MSYNVHTSVGYIDFTIKDTAADGYCAPGYAATYDTGVGWKPWTYLGQACGNGTSISDYKWLDSAYVFGTRVKVCRGRSDGTSLTCSSPRVTS